MSHPAGNSSRCSRAISRKRRRIRLRTTAPPRAFLMLKPKRLCGRLFAFRKAVKWELERRFPARYTASNCAFCTSRAWRGYCNPVLLGCKAMASLLAASRQDLAATYGLHARAKSVRFGAAALARLICALWQSNPPLRLRVAPGESFSAKPKRQLSDRFRGCLRNYKCTLAPRARSRNWFSASRSYRAEFSRLFFETVQAIFEPSQLGLFLAKSLFGLGLSRLQFRFFVA